MTQGWLPERGEETREVLLPGRSGRPVGRGERRMGSWIGQEFDLNLRDGTTPVERRFDDSYNRGHREKARMQGLREQSLTWS